MKLTHLANTVENNENLIARFGDAALIKRPEGSCVLAGGSREGANDANAAGAGLRQAWRGQRL